MKREERGRGGVVACFSSSRTPRMGKDRNMAGFNKGHWLPPPNSSTAVLRETLVACLIKRRCAA